MNRTVTAEDREIFLDIYEDLAKDVGKKLNWDTKSYDRKAAMTREPFHACYFDVAEKFGREHPKFPLIAKYFQRPERKMVDCHNRQDWWTGIVRMLDDAKLYLSEADRKELYMDLRDLIGHRLERKEF